MPAVSIYFLYLGFSPIDVLIRSVVLRYQLPASSQCREFVQRNLEVDFSGRAKSRKIDDFHMSRGSTPWLQNHHRDTTGVFLGGPGGRRVILVDFDFRLKTLPR